MVSRSRFFAASLWAALAPAGLFVVCLVLVMVFPKFHRLGDIFLLGSGLALIGVPFVYTAAVVATYGIGRGLFELQVLNRITLTVVYGVLAVAGAWLLTWWSAAGDTDNVARNFAAFLALGAVTAGSTAFIWWRVVSRVVPGALDDEPHIRMRRRQRKSFFQRLANKW
jgi:hypothetical protein